MSNGRESLLLVDDDPMGREALARRLRRSGYRVAEAGTGFDALEWLRHNPTDLVLLDIRMPDMNGMEVLTTLRKDFPATRLPVIMVTAMTDSHDIVVALREGANDYVTKPVDFQVALARIQAHLALKQAESAIHESEERLALATLGSSDGLWDWDLRTDEVHYNPRWKGMIGYEDSQIGKSPEEWLGRVHPDDIESLRERVKAHLAGRTSHFEHEYRILHADGQYRWMLGRGLAVRDPQGAAYRIAGSQTDITKGKVDDALTALPNRVLFLECVARLMQRARANPRYQFAVIFLDLDGFKVVNESLGYPAGDELLVTVARRLEKYLRSTDAIARFGAGHVPARLAGDEFAVLLDNIRHPADALRVAERLGGEIARPITVKSQEVVTSASMGIVLDSSSYEKPEELLRDAHTAMNRAKQSGKNRVELFATEMRADALARLQLEVDLRRAIEREEFQNFYQPIVDLRTGKLAGFESLIRWRHPSRGILLPKDFVPMAEENLLIIPIDQWVLHSACAQLQEWRSRYDLQMLTIHVNVSGRHFMQPTLVEEVERTLVKSRLPGSCLHLEITEGTVIVDPEAAISIMTRLKQLGAHLSLDDFGTGYSSLSYLSRFPLDSLKIDMSFTRGICTNQENLQIAQVILALAKGLGLRAIAEGVETAEQCDKLRSIGCEYAQGYYFGRPASTDSTEELIRQGKSW